MMEYLVFAVMASIFSALHYYISLLFLKIIAYVGDNYLGSKKDFTFIGIWFGYACFILLPILLMLRFRNLMKPDSIINYMETAWILFLYLIFAAVGIRNLIKNKNILLKAGYIKN